MNLVQRINRGLNDDLATFKAFEITIAIICILIPAVLRLTDTEKQEFRSSISDYVYMPHSYIFGMLLCMAAMLFLFNGAVYFRRAKRGLTANRHGKWYNVVLGLSLLAVILLPYKQNIIAHYTFAGIFFIGNAVVAAFFTQRKFRTTGILMGIFTVISFIGQFLKLFDLFWAEWISLIVIGVHFILETRGVISIRFAGNQNPDQR